MKCSDPLQSLFLPLVFLSLLVFTYSGQAQSLSCSRVFSNPLEAHLLEDIDHKINQWIYFSREGLLPIISLKGDLEVLENNLVSLTNYPQHIKKALISLNANLYFIQSVNQITETSFSNEFRIQLIDLIKIKIEVLHHLLDELKTAS